jgi:preprotein translocase subunit SecA
MLRTLLSKLVGDPNDREIKRISPFVDEVNALEPEMQARSNDELRQLMLTYKENITTETADARADLEALRQEALLASGDERRRLEVDVERAEKALLRFEDELLGEIMAQVFAAVREASVRAIGLRHYDVQIVGATLLHRGRVVEMRTGEGKTLVGTMPIVLNALAGHGAHLVTPNDYLSKVGAQQMGPVYYSLGLRVAVIQNAGGGGVDNASFEYDPEYQANDDRYQHLRPITRREAYQCDITYGTNNEFGFDYLRDNMARTLEQKSQRHLHYAILDEVDNILIDEARTPLIISGQAEESSEMYRREAKLVQPLNPSSAQSVEDKEPDGDYVVDEKSRVTYLTDAGIEKIQQQLGVENLYDSEHAGMVPYLENALKAKVLFHNDKEYVIQDGEVIIIDEFTGRMMYGRRYSEGLHQAIEAKENLKVQNESVTLATITFQNFFRMYNKLAGMTGTAATEGEEFNKIYKLEVTTLPTNIEYRAMQGELVQEREKSEGVTKITYHNPDGTQKYFKRVDYPDVVYKTEEAKFRAVVEEIKEAQRQGRPILVGTVAIETSEHLSKLLTRYKVTHEVLNAKNHEREAEIITQAGRPGSVTIATNMAGRGVDILLGGNPEGLARDALRRQGKDLTDVDEAEWQDTFAKAQQAVMKDRVKVLELGGLHVIGTERHDSRRIDNQLRGRAGRQGDPGSSRFYVSLQDDLMRRFGGQSVANLMERFGVEDDIPIEAGVVSKSLETAQTKVEGHNFDVRKHVLEYDDVVNQQREVIYAQRNRILASPNLKQNVLNLVYDELEQTARQFTMGFAEDWDVAALYNSIQAVMPLPLTMTSESWRNLTPEELIELFHQRADELYEEKEAQFGQETMREVERQLMLYVVDRLWVQHLTALDALRTGIGLRAFGQQDPLVAYKREAHEMYGQLVQAIQTQIATQIYRMEPKQQQTYQVRNVKASHASADSDSNGPTGPIRVANLPGRNDLCPCGSGKKYKHCHMRADQNGGAGQAVASEAAPSTSGRRRRRRRS